MRASRLSDAYFTPFSIIVNSFFKNILIILV
nr:MAG TPA: hypothetical protein [Caudoviricetes sp.]